MVDDGYYGEDTVCDFLHEESTSADSHIAVPMSAYLGKSFNRDIRYYTETDTRYIVRKDGVLERFSCKHMKRTTYHPSEWGVVYREALKAALKEVNSGSVDEECILQYLNNHGQILSYWDVKQTIDNKLGGTMAIVFKGKMGIACSAPLTVYKKM